MSANAWSVGLLLMIVGAVAVAGWLIERRRWTSREVALLGTLMALGAISRLPFVVMPGLQPATFLIMLTGYQFGPMAGLTVGMGVPLLSNFFLGQGPWTLWQMAAWGLCGAFAGGWGRLLTHGEDGGKSLRSALKNWQWPLLALWGLVWGYLFGAIMTLWSWLAFVEVHTWTTWLAAMALSVWTDTLHAFGNAAFFLVAGRPLSRTLQRFRR